MDEDDIFVSILVLELPDGFQERLALDVAHRAAHLDDGDLGVLCPGIPVETALDLVWMWGITCTVPPPKSPLRSFWSTDQ